MLNRSTSNSGSGGMSPVRVQVGGRSRKQVEDTLHSGRRADWVQLLIVAVQCRPISDLRRLLSVQESDVAVVDRRCSALITASTNVGTKEL